MSRDGRRRRALTAAAVALPLVAAMVSPSGTAQAADRRTVTGTKPTWAHSSADRGRTSDSQRIDAKVWLSGRDPQGLDAYAAAVSTPGTPEFGKYLTPQQFNQRFGATRQQAESVTSWLSGAGLTVDRAGSNSHYVHVTGNLDDATKAFATDFHNYATDGTVYRAPAHDATVPASIASTVLTVTGLDNAQHIRQHDEALPPPDPNFNVAQPCADYYGQKVATKQPAAYGEHQPVAMCGLLPKQLRGAYGATASGLTGKGVTVAITDAYAAPRMEEMANRFFTRHGDRAFASGQYREVLPADFDLTEECGASGWYGEEALDITAVHAMAPDAKVVYVGGRDCADGLDEAMLNIVDNHLADIVTNSWGELSQDVTPPLIKSEEAIFKQGAAEGIGFYFSTGDCGYNAPATPCGAGSEGRQTDMPVSDPWVTAVGGTSLAVNKDNGYRFETGWNFMNDNLSADGSTWSPAPPGTYPGAYAGGSGGGTSELFDQPSYQRGVVPDALSTRLPDGTKSKKAMREIPDIAAVGDSTTGIRYAQYAQLPDGTFGYAESRVGGTSLSSPVIAGLQALAQQAQGSPIGFANPAIYARANHGLYHDVTDHPLGDAPVAFVRTDFTDPSTASLPLVFHLRTTGNFGIPASDALPATQGYDDITGVGTPTSRYLLSYGR